MATYQVTGPDGKKYRVQAPEGASEAEIKARVNDHINAPRKGLLGTIDAGIRGAADMASFGLADKFAAATNALIPMDRLMGRNVKSVWDTGDFGDAYRANLKQERALTSYDERNHPVARVTGQIAGAFVPVPGAAAVKGTRLGQVISKGAQKVGGKGVLGRVAVEALKGAGQGAAYEFNKADGPITQRLQKAKQGAQLGGLGGGAGGLLGAGLSRVIGGQNVPKNVRTLANAGIVLTPGRRAGAGSIRQRLEDSVLGSIPIVNAVPNAAKARSRNQLNIAAINEGALSPIGQSLPMDTPPGHDTIKHVQDLVYGAYGDSLAALGLVDDPALQAGVDAIRTGAVANVGQGNAPQLGAIIDRTLEPLQNGSVSGDDLQRVMSGVRGEASRMAGSVDANQRAMGDQLWALHDEIDNALARQNPQEALGGYKNAREAVAGLRRIEDAAARGTDGVFNPTQLMQSVRRKGFGTTTGKLAAGEARLQELANAAKDVMPDVVPNSGTPERYLGAGLLGGTTSLAGSVDPTLGALTGASLLGYIPGVDRLLQDFAINRPDVMRRIGGIFGRSAPALGAAGTVTGLSYVPQQ